MTAFETDLISSKNLFASFALSALFLFKNLETGVFYFEPEAKSTLPVYSVLILHISVWLKAALFSDMLQQNYQINHQQNNCSCGSCGIGYGLTEPESFLCNQDIGQANSCHKDGRKCGKQGTETIFSLFQQISRSHPQGYHG